MRLLVVILMALAYAASARAADDPSGVSHYGPSGDYAASARAADDPPPPHFTDFKAASGIAASYDGDWQFMVGGGVAAFDCAHDGRPSVLIAGGQSKAKFFRNLSKPGGVPKFELQASGLELESVIGAYPIDIDGDGEVDLVVLRIGEIDLMRGLGNCRFENANGLWGFQSQDAWWTAFSATWEKGQKWPTLAFGDLHTEPSLSAG